MINSIYILKMSGLPIISRRYNDIKGERTTEKNETYLETSLFAAVNTYAQTAMGQHLTEIGTEKTRYFFYVEGEICVVVGTNDYDQFIRQNYQEVQSLVVELLTEIFTAIITLLQANGVGEHENRIDDEILEKLESTLDLLVNKTNNELKEIISKSKGHIVGGKDKKWEYFSTFKNVQVQLDGN